MEVLYSSWSTRLGEDHPKVEEIPKGISVFERMRTNRIETTRPICRVECVWNKNESRGARHWRAKDYSREWVDISKEDPLVENGSVTPVHPIVDEPKPGGAVKGTASPVAQKVGGFPVSERAVQASLKRYLDKETALSIWLTSCAEAGLKGLRRWPGSSEEVSNEGLRSVVKVLREGEGVSQVVGEAMNIKIAVHDIEGMGDIPRACIRQDCIRSPERLQKVAESGILRKENKKKLDKLAKKASEEVGMPCAFVSGVLDEAQVVAGVYGPIPQWMKDIGGVPVEWSSCQEVIKREEIVTVENAKENRRTKDNPITTNNGVLSYIGAPIRVEGRIVGVISAGDQRPKRFREKEKRELLKLGNEASRFLGKT
jgi:hypothetical protein